MASVVKGGGYAKAGGGIRAARVDDVDDDGRNGDAYAEVNSLAERVKRLGGRVVLPARRCARNEKIGRGPAMESGIEAVSRSAVDRAEVVVEVAEEDVAVAKDGATATDDGATTAKEEAAAVVVMAAAMAEA
jgi:DNA-binding ferritin-like protein